MKRFLLIATFVAALFVSCTETEKVGLVPTIEPSGDFTATIDQTRAELNGNAVIWNSEDLVTIFTKTSHNRKYQITELSDDSLTATFGYVSYTGTDKTKITTNYALYPYDVDATLSGGVITTSINPAQVYGGNSLEYAIMAAASNSTDFAFKNACALIRFKVSVSDILPDTFMLNAITLSTASKAIAGEVTIDLNGGDVKAVVTANGVNEICLSAIDTEIDSEVKEFNVVVPATAFDAQELTVSFEFEDGSKSFELPAFELQSGKIKTITYEIKEAEEFTGSTPNEEDNTASEHKPANNEIWYTSTDGEIVEPHKSTAFNVDIVSNTYDTAKECWVIKFDGDVTTIGDWAFDNCSSLTNVTIPDSVTEIDRYAFMDCSSLTSVNIPDSVTKIGHYAFYGCSSLASITIPNSVKEIENNPFSCCTSLREFKGEYAIDSGHALALEGVFIAFAPGCDATEIHVDNNITKIASEAFRGCSTLQNISLPISLIEIGDSAFNRCNGLTSITIPENVKEIRGLAFYYCENLHSVYFKTIIPPVTSSISNMFKSNASERKIYVYDECLDVYKSQWEEYSDSIVAYGAIPNPDVTTSISYKTTDEQIVEISTLPIKSNTYNNGLGELVVYGELTSIPANTFANCDRLKTITIPSSVIEIKDNVFLGCDNIEKFSGNFASDDGNYIILDGKIAYVAKANLTETLTIPDNIIVIGQEAFSGCSTIVEVVIPDSVIKIEQGAFAACRNLLSVAIGSSVEDIGGNAFSNTRIAEVSIPMSVNSIGPMAFDSTYSVYFQALTPPSISYAFPSQALLHVPNAAKDAYIAQWGSVYPNISGY